MSFPELWRTGLRRRPPHPPPVPWRRTRERQHHRALLVPPPARARGRLDRALPRTRRRHRDHADGQRDLECDRAPGSSADDDRATQRCGRPGDRRHDDHTELVARPTPPRRHRRRPGMARRTRSVGSPQVTPPPGSSATDNREPEVVRAERLVAGGAALSRRDDGRIVLVDDALPGEVVEVTIGRRHGTDRGTVVRIVEPSPDRIAPRCPHVADGCGGCDLAAFGYEAPLAAQRGLVTDSLRRLGRWHDPVVSTGPALDPWGFRTTLRLAVRNGRAGLRQSASNDVVELDHCLVAHPMLDELIAEGRFPGASYVTLRVGAATGERLALV